MKKDQVIHRFSGVVDKEDPELIGFTDRKLNQMPKKCREFARFIFGKEARTCSYLLRGSLDSGEYFIAHQDKKINRDPELLYISDFSLQTSITGSHLKFTKSGEIVIHFYSYNYNKKHITQQRVSFAKVDLMKRTGGKILLLLSEAEKKGRGAMTNSMIASVLDVFQWQKKYWFVLEETSDQITYVYGRMITTRHVAVFSKKPNSSGTFTISIKRPRGRNKNIIMRYDPNASKLSLLNIK